jgi:hypothetical protein
VGIFPLGLPVGLHIVVLLRICGMQLPRHNDGVESRAFRWGNAPKRPTGCPETQQSRATNPALYWTLWLCCKNRMFRINDALKALANPIDTVGDFPKQRI